MTVPNPGSEISKQAASLAEVQIKDARVLDPQSSTYKYTASLFVATCGAFPINATKDDTVRPSLGTTEM